MKLARRPSELSTATGSVVTIGNFDGVHRGHQRMFADVVRRATADGLAATVVTFEPLPHEYFRGAEAPARLQGLRDRVQSIAACGLDRLLLLRFDAALAGQSAVEFAETVLVEALATRHLVVGDDFRFGRDRTGDRQLLERVGATHGFTVASLETVEDEGERVSSSRIRRHLMAGELDAAARLLGRPYRITGRVAHGQKIGRQLGFPTANIALGKLRPPLRGVFAADVYDHDTGRTHPSVVNLGERPTVGGRRLLLEAHLLDGTHELYGHHLACDFLSRLRGERTFESLDALKAQIDRDAHAARERLAVGDPAGQGGPDRVG